MFWSIFIDEMWNLAVDKREVYGRLKCRKKMLINAILNSKKGEEKMRLKFHIDTVNFFKLETLRWKSWNRITDYEANSFEIGYFRGKPLNFNFGVRKPIESLIRHSETPQYQIRRSKTPRVWNWRSITPQTWF